MLTHSDFGFAPYPAPGAGGKRVLSASTNLASNAAHEQVMQERNLWHSGTEAA